MSVLLGLLAFCVMAALDYAWAKYTVALGERAALKAALWSVGLFLGSALITTAYMTNGWTLVPAAAGGFIGTYAAVRRR